MGTNQMIDEDTVRNNLGQDFYALKMIKYMSTYLL